MNKARFKDLFYLFIGLTIFTGLFPSCGGGNRPSDNKYKEAARYFAADESLSPVIDEELDIFHMKSKRDSIYPLYISEQEAIDKLLNQEVLLVFTTRSLTQNEENIIKERQYRPRVITLAYDALALIVNKANPDTLINVDNFRKIMSGEVTQWKELYPDSRLGDIKVAFDNPKSSTVRYVVDSIMQGTPLKTDGNVRAAMTSAEVVEYVESHENAIGVVGSIWLNDQRDTTNLTYGRNITVMKVGKSADISRETTYKPSQWTLQDLPQHRRMRAVRVQFHRKAHPADLCDEFRQPYNDGIPIQDNSSSSTPVSSQAAPTTPSEMW